MKILIVTAAFYPIISPRSFRATELAIEFAKQGHEVTVYTIVGHHDYNNFSKQYNIKIKNIHGIKHYRTNNQAGENIFFNRILIKLFGKLLLFPEIELIFRLPRALKKETNHDLLISIARPYSIHFGIVRSLKNNNRLCKKWVADCGDPFMKNPMVSIPFYFYYLERKFCQIADFITLPAEKAKKAYDKKYLKKIAIIPQGFNLKNINLAKYTKNKKCTFAYSGVFYKDKRDPSKFLDYLLTLEEDFLFVIYTNSHSLLSSYFSELGHKLQVKSYIPREELLFELSKVDFLINFENEGDVQVPSKLIDYCLTGRPICSLSGRDFNPHIFNQFLRGNYQNALILEDIRKYDIENIAKQFIELTLEK